MKKLIFTVAVLAAMVTVACSTKKVGEEIFVKQAQEYADKLVKEGKDDAANAFMDEVVPAVQAKDPVAAASFAELQAKEAVDSLAAAAKDKAQEVSDSVSAKVSDAKDAVKDAAAAAKDKTAEAAGAVKDKAANAAAAARKRQPMLSKRALTNSKTLSVSNPNIN